MIAVILAILPMESIALIPALLGLGIGVLSFILSKNESKKLIKFVLFVSILALAIIGFKAIFSGDSEVANDVEFIEKSQQSEEKAIEELENLEDLDIFEESDSIQ